MVKTVRFRHPEVCMVCQKRIAVGKDELLERDYLHRHRLPFACTLRVGRLIGGSCANFTSLALQPLAVNIPPAFDRKWFLHLANRSQLHAFSQGRAFLCFVARTRSIGDRRTETCAAKLRAQKKKKKNDGTTYAFTSPGIAIEWRQW